MTQEQVRMLRYKLLVTTVELVPSAWGSYSIFECPGTFVCEVDTVCKVFQMGQHTEVYQVWQVRR